MECNHTAQNTRHTKTTNLFSKLQLGQFVEIFIGDDDADDDDKHDDVDHNNDVQKQSAVPLCVNGHWSFWMCVCVCVSIL